DVISRICKFLECQPADIMEYVPEETPEKTKRD
ncbi:transcriptional regulator, partial [Klebsiella oxytoca]